MDTIGVDTTGAATVGATRADAPVGIARGAENRADASLGGGGMN